MISASTSTYLGYKLHTFVWKLLYHPLKSGTWALTREWALAQDTMVCISVMLEKIPITVAKKLLLVSLSWFMLQIGDRVISHREPNPDEARIQAMSVIAACAKGLMYFQSEVSLILFNHWLSIVKHPQIHCSLIITKINNNPVALHGTQKQNGYWTFQLYTHSISVYLLKVEN